MFQSFNLLDWGIFIVMVLSILIGFYWGLIRTLVSALIWVLSFFVSTLAGPTLSAMFANYVGNGVLQLWLTYGVVFIATIVIAMIARVILRFMLTPNQIGVFDRLAGAGLGLVRGVLIVSVFLWFMALSGFSNVQGGLYQTSILAGWFQPYVNMVSAISPSVERAIQNAGQQQNASQQPSTSGPGNYSQPVEQTSGPNPYSMMGPADSGGGSGLLSGFSGLQGIMPWINELWNMMVHQVQSIL